MPKSLFQILIDSGNFTCPGCAKNITNEIDAVRVGVYAHRRCADASPKILLSDPIRKEFNKQLKLFPEILKSRIPKKDKLPRLEKINKKELAEFKRLKKEGLL